MFLYYITDRKQFPGTDCEQHKSLLHRIGCAAAAGIDYIQLREKDLSPKELEIFAREALNVVRDYGPSTRLLINSRIDIALAVGTDGVHLTSTGIFPSDARAIRAASIRENTRSTLQNPWVVAVSCHSLSEVQLAESHGADFVVLAPIFEKPGTNAPALGLGALSRAALQQQLPDTRVEAGDQRAKIPVFALGGITVANASECPRYGASGVAGIRLFQQGDIAETVKILRQRI